MSIPYAKVIVNPVAGAYSTRRKWRRISKLLRHVGLSFDYEYTDESSERILVHADGELLGEGPASFWLVPAALSIVVG